MVVRFVAALALASPMALSGATLSDAESAQAERLARTVPWESSRVGTRSNLDRITHPLGVQTLAVEREPGKRTPTVERRARVYQHDHEARRTRRVRMDLVTGEVVDIRTIDSPHLPLNDAEQRWALERLAASAPLLARLRDEQRARGRTPFVTLDALDVKASIFEPPDALHPCHVERCALLSLFDETRTVFAIEPLVRFASGKVETLDASGSR